GAGARGPLPRAHLRGPGARPDQALRLHAATERRFDRARTELLLGEYLRRDARLADARAHLQSARVAFDELGATGWAERAGDALRASGGTSNGSVASKAAALEPQELQIARLVAHGHSNREVAARLFLSPRTVEADVRAIFAKLGISSRVELAECGFATDHSGELLRSRLARAGLAELFRDLRNLRGPTLQDALASTLGDPE